MPVEIVPPDFQGIYLDTNVLLRGQGWPSPSIQLNNLLRLAGLCKIDRFLPEPVLKEAEEHWLRGVKEGISTLSGAKKELQRLANPMECEIKLDHLPVETLLERYRKQVDTAIQKYQIARTPFTSRTVEEVFGFATKYLLPFTAKGEGKGFQDAAILLSILDHLNLSSTSNAIFITGDGDFGGLNLDFFNPGFDSKRLRIITLDTAFEFLSKKYYEESVIKPYEQEKQNALKAIEDLSPQIRDFIEPRVTLDMIKPDRLGGTIRKVLYFQEAFPVSVETPLPEPNTPDRSVEMLIKVVAAYRVLMAGGVRLSGNLNSLALLRGERLEFLPLSEEQEVTTVWRGAIQATADVAGREFKNIKFVSLVPEDASLPEEGSALKARASAQFWKTARIDEDRIIEGTKIPPQTKAPQTPGENT